MHWYYTINLLLFHFADMVGKDRKRRQNNFILRDEPISELEDEHILQIPKMIRAENHPRRLNTRYEISDQGDTNNIHSLNIYVCKIIVFINVSF